ncbi:hypothetical protein JYU34_000013 [Plutella xylostella]|uniref:Uncharacterized protein n=1 Tax=Plutella xylostella TaxID=51655 RepID=A0ABQ7R6M5_PLUXY|nr:hypothetical protein JYU34_000013 [Plutella xylostella]
MHIQLSTAGKTPPPPPPPPRGQLVKTAETPGDGAPRPPTSSCAAAATPVPTRRPHICLDAL